MATLFSVRADYYRAVALACAKEDYRPALCGVHIEPHPVEGVLLVATDGYRMFVAHDRDGKCPTPALVSITGVALKAGKTSTDGQPRRFVARSTSAVTVDSTVFDVRWKLDGDFPDWRRVLPNPKQFRDVVPAFNPLYLADFGKVAAELSIKHPCVGMRSAKGMSPALVRVGHDDFFGLLMPMRPDDPVVQMPYFMSPKYRKSEKAA